jgi:transcriptional regulator with XRE-family HTH domain
MTLEQLRIERSLSQAEVARELKVTTTAVWKWETAQARPQPVNVRGLAAMYGVTIQDVWNAIDATAKSKS